MIKIDFFEFNRDDYEYICNKCMLDGEYKKLLEMEIKGYTRVKMANELKVGIDTLDKMIHKLKKKITKIL